MTLQKKLLASVLFSVALPGMAIAQSFPCVQGCDAAGVTKQVQVKNTVQTLPQDPLLGKFYGVSSFLRGEDLKGISLTQTQKDAITQIIETQLPDIFNQIKSLEDAHALLRDMALSKQYDDGLATALTKTIAESSARLALMQAQREYQVYEILTPEQAKNLKIIKGGT